MYKILIVDDEQIERDGVRFLLNKFAYPFEISARNNGREALAFLEEQPVDVICTDIKMPFMDGLELCAEARKLCPSVRLILLTAYSEFSYAKKAIQVQADDYLLKPVELDEFKRVMDRIVAILNRQEEERKNRQRKLEQYRANPQGGHLMLEELLSDMAGSSETDRPEEHGLIQEAAAIIRQEYARDLSLASLADRLHVSKGYLSTLFKKETSIGVMQYITMLRMQKAQQLLSETSLRIGEIAEAVGYHDVSYFGLTFKKTFGMTPAHYRNGGPHD